MLLKKCNAAASWLLTLSLLGHLATMSYSMLTSWYNYTVCKLLAHTTAGIAVIHIALSLILLSFFHDGSDFRRYRKNNLRVILQRASGLVIIVLLHLHVQAFGFIVTGEALSGGQKAQILITEILFFGAIFTHLAVSFSRSLISLGLLREEASEKKADRISYKINLLLFMITTFALVSFVTAWTGFAG